MGRIDGALRRAGRRAAAYFAEKESGERTRLVVFVNLLLLIAAVMFLLNVHTPLQMDDYDYSFSWSTGERLSGVADVLASQAAHYRLWGGRSVVHALAQLFLYWGKPAFNFANTAMYIVLLLEIYALARSGERRWDWGIVLAAHLFLFFCVPFFGTVFLWLDGACNYLWGTALALVPLLIDRSAREGGFFARGGWRGALAAAAGFFAGWTNENTACGVLALIIILIVRDRLRGEDVRPWRYMAAAAQALGTAVMLLAPGNFARASAVESGPLLLEWARSAAIVTAYGAVYAGVLLAAIPLLRALGRALSVPMRTEHSLMLLLCGLLAGYALIVSPQISDRSFTGVLVLILAAALTLLADIGAKAREFDAARWAALPFALAILLYGGYQAAEDVIAHEAAWTAQVARIEEAAAAGKAQVSVSSVPSYSRFTMDILLADDAEQWPNSTLSRAFGIDVLGE